MAQTGEHTAHTPGPWEIGRVNSGPVAGAIPITTQGYRETFRDGVLITSVYGSAARSEANARLIAASPEMLSELKRDLQFAREMKKLMEALKGRGWVQYELAAQRIEALETIIARAEGR